MAENLRVLLLVGSPKLGASNSDSLGTYLLERIEELGDTVNKLRISSCLDSEAGEQLLITSVEQAEVVILTSPLYADALPASVTRALEILAGSVSDTRRAAEIRWAALLNGGFPQPQQNSLALAICRRFAEDAGFAWAGGIALSMGEALRGRPLVDAGAPFFNVRKALGFAALALSAGEALDTPKLEALAKPSIPVPLYRVASWMDWRRQSLKERPLLEMLDRLLK